MCIKWLRMIGLLSVAILLTGPARADIDLRVESRPMAGPIEAFVRVTDGSGSVTGLTAADFAVTLDVVPLNMSTFGLPPDQDPTQKLSIIFIIASASSVARDTVTDFINQMTVGDHAAIIKFRTNRSADPSIPPPASPVLQPFTLVDGGAGTNTLISFAANTAFAGRVMAGWAISAAVGQFVTPPVTLPNGPKAIVLIGNVHGGYGTHSDAMALANANGIPIFTLSTGDISADAAATAVMMSLAEDTGGHYFPARTREEITEAFTSLAGLLNNAYQLTIPNIAVTDCNPHMLEVTAQGQSESAAFTRCDSTPDDFDFAGQSGVALGAVVVSDSVTITGIESPVSLTVIGGEYSIGCGLSFTSAPGVILPNEQVCVRHIASADPETSTRTLLIVGGVSSSFWSSTSGALPPPPVSLPPPATGGSGGGGGATGVIELLLSLGALFAQRRRRQSWGIFPRSANRGST
ncbi:MAG: hypothetical protein WAW79_06925 [Steroidobacteraceae bacterium]